MCSAEEELVLVEGGMSFAALGTQSFAAVGLGERRVVVGGKRRVGSFGWLVVLG